MLVEADDFFEQFIQLAIAQHPLNVRQPQWLWRFQPVGAGDQFGRALRADIAGVRLGNWLEKADFQAGTLQCAHQPQADRSQAHTKISGGNKESLHASFLT